MSFKRRIKYFLVHTLGLSNKAAQQLIDDGSVQVDGSGITDNCLLSGEAEIKVNGSLVRQRKAYVYLAFHKPPGFESTLNTGIEQNLSPFFEGYNNLAIAGRLDKASEGLLLLSNDGKWVEAICNPKFEKEKEYFVTLDHQPTAAFVETFKQGVSIGDYITRPCHCHIAGQALIHVILTEGRNRQIRRMCKALGYGVLRLQRVRIDRCVLGDLEAGKFNVIKI